MDAEREKELDQKRISIIRERIKSEFNKHGNTDLDSLDWTAIAAIKINIELKNLENE